MRLAAPQLLIGDFPKPPPNKYPRLAMVPIKVLRRRFVVLRYLNLKLVDVLPLVDLSKVHVRTKLMRCWWSNPCVPNRRILRAHSRVWHRDCEGVSSVT